jgi:cellulose synthase operon protein C
MPATKLRIIAASLVLALGAGLVIACGFDFPAMLTQDRQAALQHPVEGNFQYDMQHLLATPGQILPHAPGDGYTDDQDQASLESLRSKAENQGLSKAQAALILRMRQAADGNSAYALGQDLPEDVRLYTAAAVDFGLNHGRAEGCEASLPPPKRGVCLQQRKEASARAARQSVQRFKAVLALPARQRQLRGVWAAYSLARSENENLPDTSLATIDGHFELARQLALTGAPDPLFLGLDSYGAQAAAHLERKDHVGAVALYAEQASYGSLGATASLRMMAQTLLHDPALLERNISTPLVQRLLIRYLLAYGADDTAADNALANFQASSVTSQAATAAPRRLQSFIAALERAGIKAPADGDRLAAAAYAQGNFEAAGKFARRSDTALAHWIEAKLALRNGHPEDARRLFAEALTNPAALTDNASQTRLRAENGTLLLARGDIHLAFEQFYAVAGKYWNDTAYLAERILTTDELKAFVDARVPRPSVTLLAHGTATKGYIPRPDPGAEWPAFSPAIQLRDLLARRLMREGRYDEALGYFHSASDEHFEPRIDVREQAHAYILALRRADHAWTATGRAESLYEAAHIARWNGMEIMGYELTPDWYVYGGSAEDVILPPKAGKLALSPEIGRFASSTPVIEKRFHYRYRAAQLAMQAAESLPPRSLTYAQIHANAFSWLINRDPDAARKIYQHYLQHGAAGAFRPATPNFWNARFFSLRHMTDNLTDNAFWHGLRSQLRPHKTAVFAGLGSAVILLLGGLVVFVRRRNAPPRER